MTNQTSAVSTPASTPRSEPLLSVRGVSKYFPGGSSGLLGRRGKPIKAVDGVSFSVEQGQTLGLVGESGCGKSTTGRVISKLLEPTAGEIRFNGRDIAGLKPREMKAYRSEIQMIFQDPFSSLNPRHTVGTIVGAPFLIQVVKPEYVIKA